MRAPEFRAVFDGELVVDSFAGGGGASTGIEAAIGRHVDIAINHDATAIAMHRANHPATKHYTCDVWEVDPREATQGRPVGLAWFSPACTHFSRAKGNTNPLSARIRSLAWVVVRWAKAVRPRVICLENVEEFESWGPLSSDGRPDPKRAGRTFRQWVGRLRGLGYAVEFRSLSAADYGAPTTRRRLFMIARCDGQRIVWPSPTHGRHGARPWVPASEIIDWSLPVPSIFDRPRPLAEATLRRIAEGVRRYVVEAREPFVVRGNVAPTLIQTGYGERDGQAPRALDLGRPLGTVVAGGAKHALVTALLTKHYGGVVGHGLQRTLGTVTSQDHHSLTTATLVPGGCDRRDEVRAFLVKYYGTSDAGQQLGLPLGTVTTRDRFGLVTVHGQEYEIADIGMRMLAPLELFRAQGFPASYIIDRDADGNATTKTAQIRLCGNSVCPPVAQAIVSANFLHGRGEVAA